MICDIEIAFDNYTIVYRINQETIEKCLRASDCDDIYYVIIDQGEFVGQTSTESDIFLDMTVGDDETFGDFQNALLDFVCDMEEDMANKNQEDFFLM